MSAIAFVKMEGTGNDFVLVDALRGKNPVTASVARRLADRRRGVGCDQVLVALPSRGETADVRMQIFNQDGSEAEMCGNGIRCLALYLKSRGIVRSAEMRVETRAGLMIPRIVGREVRVDMGPARLEASEIPVALSGRVVDRPLRVGDLEPRITCVSMGNPHAVLFVPRVDDFPVLSLGPRIEHHHLFPERTNVEFVEVQSRSRLRMRVWERGAGETPACGTGACAALVAACLNERTGRKVRIDLPGGSLEVEWLKNGHVTLKGPAVEVFQGEIRA